MLLDDEISYLKDSSTTLMDPFPNKGKQKAMEILSKKREEISRVSKIHLGGEIEYLEEDEIRDVVEAIKRSRRDTLHCGEIGSSSHEIESSSRDIGVEIGTGSKVNARKTYGIPAGMIKSANPGSSAGRYRQHGLTCMDERRPGDSDTM